MTEAVVSKVYPWTVKLRVHSIIALQPLDATMAEADWVNSRRVPSGDLA